MKSIRNPHPIQAISGLDIIPVHKGGPRIQNPTFARFNQTRFECESREAVLALSEPGLDHADYRRIPARNLRQQTYSF